LTVTKTISKTDLKIAEILNDYRIINESREASLLGRKEVFMGKAKFGIFGDGKEVAQVAMAKVFRNGDFRSGYYRDQTFMFSIGELTVQQYFAQLYAHTDVKAEPASAGRLMNGHFATRLLDDNGLWLPQTSRKNSSSDVSCTAAQMPRLVGLAYASKLYRQNSELKDYVDFSINGNEIAFGTIGNASTSEGIFLESINAAGVLQIPMIICIWDDDYGISVPQKYHTTKQDISKALEGFRRNKDGPGYEIFVVKGWDYDALYKTFKKAEKIARNEHVPVMIHVKEMTQPQGHSTSGSHERYKSTRRLEWEKEFDCISKMREWILDQDLVAAEQLDLIEIEAKQSAKDAKNKAWKEFIADIKSEQREACLIMERLSQQSVNGQLIGNLKVGLEKTLAPIRMDTIGTVKKALRLVRKEKVEAKTELQQWLEKTMELNYDRYSSYLYSQSPESALNISEIKPVYSEQSKLVDGREVLRANFDAALTNDPRVVAFGEDVGRIGDVNQAFAGLQKKHGELRVMDTGIRESAIIGEGIGLAMRGLKPIAEIQYLDYLIYAIQTLSDDLSTLQYRTKGGQKAPLIIRTRGHRLEGVWHSGSPMGMILGSLRGIYVLVPRDMTRAAGFYNTMLRSDDPALIIECLNGYRLKERMPDNIGEFTIPLGIPEVIREGTDVTVVTYGSMCRLVMEAAEQLGETGISCEVLDVQTLLPFDSEFRILESVKKTNRVVFADEDVPGGATAFMLNHFIEKQKGYYFLDSPPATISAKEHRPAYSSDGDYFSKPSVDEIFDRIYDLMSEVDPKQYPDMYLS